MWQVCRRNELIVKKEILIGKGNTEIQNGESGVLKAFLHSMEKKKNMHTNLL